MDEFPKLLDLPRIFAKLRSLGAEDIELYAECRKMQRLDVWDRVHRVEQIAEKGLSIHCHKGSTSFHFSCHPMDTDSVIKLIEARRFLQPTAEPRTSSPREKVNLMPPQTTGTPHAVTVLNLARAAFAQGVGKVSRCDLLFEEERVEFWVSRDESGWTPGQSACARISAEWLVEQEDLPAKKFTWEKQSLNPDALVEALRNQQWLFEKVRKSAVKTTAWPAPQGELPLYWSAQAFAKLMVPFVRAFEADLFLKQDSFLPAMEFPAQWPLTLLEEGGTQVDAQGTPRNAFTLLKGGKPRGLACDRKTAAEMQVQPTGHARRAHFRHQPVTGLWNITVDMDEVVPDVLQTSPWGIWIDDVDVMESSTKSGLVCVRVQQAYLLHDKTKGEAIEPVVFEMAIPDFLGVIRSASEQTERFGFVVDKEGQSLVTELETPTVFTPDFPYPGTVPTDTYW